MTDYKLLSAILPLIVGIVVALINTRKNKNTEKEEFILMQSLEAYIRLDSATKASECHTDTAILVSKVINSLPNKVYLQPNLLEQAEYLIIISSNIEPSKAQKKEIDKVYTTLKSMIYNKINETKKSLGYPYSSLWQNIKCKFGVFSGVMGICVITSIYTLWIALYLYSIFHYGSYILSQSILFLPNLALYILNKKLRLNKHYHNKVYGVIQKI